VPTGIHLKLEDVTVHSDPVVVEMHVFSRWKGLSVAADTDGTTAVSAMIVAPATTSLWSERICELLVLSSIRRG
jgi:hypothetical protein